jgi:hypothetical protein
LQGKRDRALGFPHPGGNVDINKRTTHCAEREMIQSENTIERCSMPSADRRKKQGVDRKFPVIGNIKFKNHQNKRHNKTFRLIDYKMGVK